MKSRKVVGHPGWQLIITLNKMENILWYISSLSSWITCTKPLKQSSFQAAHFSPAWDCQSLTKDCFSWIWVPSWLWSWFSPLLSWLMDWICWMNVGTPCRQLCLLFPVLFLSWPLNLCSSPDSISALWKLDCCWKHPSDIFLRSVCSLGCTCWNHYQMWKNEIQSNWECCFLSLQHVFRFVLSM